MIFFIPAYDDATRANLSVVTPIIPQNSVQLLEQNATHANLWQHLSNDSLLFAMAHGDSDAIWDNNEVKRALALEDNIHFIGKKAFIFACFTANELGYSLKANNSIYWGYTGSIAAPTHAELLTPIFTSIFQHIITFFPNCDDIQTISSSMHILKLLCNNAENEIDMLWEVNDEMDVMSSYNCLNHIWNRLRVHHFNHKQVIQHPESQIGDLFE